MRFILLVKAPKDFEAGRPLDEETMSKMADWTEALIKAGARIGADRLHPSSKGTRVRYSRGKFQVIDGPFAESKELIAGYCLIRANSRDEAVEWAKRVPFEEGEIEVRPVLESEDLPDSFGGDPKEHPRKPGTIRYLALVKSDSNIEAGNLPDEKAIAAMGAFLEEGAKSGVFLSADGLQPSSKGARVRYTGSQRTVIDGPFAESKELVAGFVLLQFPSKEEAIEWARRFVQIDAPGRGGESECEIRPIFEFDDYGPSPAVERFRKMGIGPKS
jgi:hypothetical protein